MKKFFKFLAGAAGLAAVAGGVLFALNKKTEKEAVDDDADFNDDGKVTVLSLMIKAGMIKSNGEGRRLIQQGGVSVNDEKISDVFTAVSRSDVESGVIIRKGKKVFRKFTL